ncbi:DNA helicase RecQ [Paenibacillus sp. SYP-B4298]|uniref:DNA helicase RecQ n=1 Tax=Paenibacillus sp. SYP-B4298 TaxID=2996034 RepID=UPI0022DCF2D4|nr:DNA helicase RecQ [Paenibacillus sp. SYP-B4298]
MLERARHLLKRIYGYDAFRKGQAEIIAGIMEGRDTLAILPTGGGKSVCYQIPSMLLEGTTLVVSPLISLMKDQVDALNRLGVPAAYLNSSLSAGEYRDVLRKAAGGEYKLLYIAPERLDAPMFASLMEQMQIPLIAIDEAHCVSQWGHDFRPSYRQLAGWIGKLRHRPLVAAFTATATPEVARDIAEMLSLHDPNVFVTGFARSNLALSVVTGADKKRYLKEFIAQRPDQSGIVYAATRKEVDSVYEELRKQGLAVAKYHGGLSDDERADAQERFRYDEARIIVATNAFGMGIDKPNVRFVVHWQMPGDIESYYQEAGRAGRDGDESECILLFASQDIQVQRFLIEQGAADEGRKAVQLGKLYTMMNYARTERCLQQFIVEYFGEADVPPCGKCGSCLDETEAIDVTSEAQKALSCVGRMKGRFGVALVAKVLKGSKEKRIMEFGLNRLTTYALFQDWNEKDIVEWLYWLVAEGYLRVSDGTYPTVALTANALPVLEGKQQVYQKRKPLKQRTVRQASGGYSPLFDALRLWRKEAAAQEGVPPFILFFDATLREMADVQPRTEQELLSIKGVGTAKAAKYGAALLDIIAQHAGGGRSPRAGMAGVNGAAEAAAGSAAAATATIAIHGDSSEAAPGSSYDRPMSASLEAESAGVMPASELAASSRKAVGSSADAAIGEGDGTEGKPSHLISYEMFAAGAQPADIAKERGMGRMTIEGHIIRAAQEGLELEWARIIPPELEPLILEAAGQHGVDKLRTLKDALPDEVTYFAIHGVICKYELK